MKVLTFVRSFNDYLQAYYDVYPVWTYSYLAVLVVVFLLTDFLRYKAVIVFEGFAYVATWCLLIFGEGVPLMQVKILSKTYFLFFFLMK